MNKEELKDAVNGLADGGSAQVIAAMVISTNDPELDTLFIKKVLQKAAEGHHQTREFALAGLKVINA